MYDNLKVWALPILRKSIGPYLRQEANNDILKNLFSKAIEVNSFAKSVKFKYPRQRKRWWPMASVRGYKEVQRLAPTYAMIDESTKSASARPLRTRFKRKILRRLAPSEKRRRE